MKIRFRKISLVLCIAAFLLTVATTATAAEVEIDGLVINRTVTRFGHDFHREFGFQWNPPAGVHDYSILIRERADARWGSRVSVLINDQLVFRTFLGVRTVDLSAVVAEAVAETHRYLLFIRDRFNGRQPDLAGDGL